MTENQHKDTSSNTIEELDSKLPEEMIVKSYNNRVVYILIIIYLFCFGYIVSIIPPPLHQFHFINTIKSKSSNSCCLDKNIIKIDNSNESNDWIDISTDNSIQSIETTNSSLKSIIVNQIIHTNKVIKQFLQRFIDFSKNLFQPIQNIVKSIFSFNIKVHAFQLDNLIKKDLTDVSPFDLSRFNLNTKQLDMVYDSLNSTLLTDNDIRKLAKDTHILISPFVVYQYHEASDWSGSYHGKSIAEAVRNTILWRKDFKINQINIRNYLDLLKKGFVRVSNLTDKFRRSIIYIKLDRFVKGLEHQAYINVVMNAVEQADRLSMKSNSNSFITLIDMKHFSLSNCPSISFFKQLVHILKFNYPGRLSAIYILNTGPAFTLIWNLVKPLLPRKAISKFIVLRGKKRIAQELDRTVGLQYVEKGYGGDDNEIDFNDHAELNNYIQSYYWESK